MTPEAPNAFRQSERTESVPSDYRPLSAMAIVAFLIALISPVALLFLDPLTWVLPLLGTVVAALAMRRISRPEMPLSGRRLAVLGLFLSLTMLVAAPTYYVSRIAWAKREAIDFADIWLEHLARGRSSAAHQMSVGARYRCPPGESLSMFYSQSKERVQERLKFNGRQPISTLLEWATSATPELVDSHIVKVGHGVDAINLDYQVRRDGDDHVLDIHLRVFRSADPKTGKNYWRIGPLPPEAESLHNH